MKDVFHVVKRALLTERTAQLQAENKYVFEVDRRAGKPEIKHAVEEIFKVSVLEVTTMNVRGKVKRLGRTEGKRPDWKKAIVTLAHGDSIGVVTQG